MVSIVYCSREKNDKHKEHLLKVSGNPNVEIIEYINKGESLTKFYNRGLDESRFDIVLFLHDDIIVESKQIVKKIVRMFEKNPEYGIIGIAGTKYLSKTGRWWEDRKKMYGRVKHSKDGKTWESNYSSDQGKRVEEMVTVDGLFFAVHKERIVKRFDENVTGFHFYDVDFCFQNHISGVKVGLTTEFKVTHLSIGETNDEWEKNRIDFSEKYKDYLPVTIEEPFIDRKMGVMISTITNDENEFNNKLDIVKGLKKLNCDITFVTNLDNKKFLLSKQVGVKLAQINEPPGYKVGDGVFSIQGPNGPVRSEVGKTYKIGLVPYDVIYTDNEDIFKSYKKMYPECKIVDIESKEYYVCDKTPEGYKKLFVDTFNYAETTD